ncbi:hypothetical protein RND71_026440 [Anisodus tanguticus]|uniref:Uncharacterized protein n=1 Tax=Anisodus tanguticus TaxID=243964 RepID=A0AAE1RNK4_9SOLA|nr:hypothetical protein RND71_026440 [Anisodus tanguticus]
MVSTSNSPFMRDMGFERDLFLPITEYKEKKFTILSSLSKLSSKANFGPWSFWKDEIRNDGRQKVFGDDSSTENSIVVIMIRDLN